MRALLALLLVACDPGETVNDITGGWGLDLPGLGVTYECVIQGPGYEDTLELCYDEDHLSLSIWESLGREGTVVCKPTQRHAGPCYYHCDGGSGCNALHGCWCP